jgi:hypothetical protein
MGSGTNVPPVRRIGHWLAVAAILGATSAAAACIGVSEVALQIEASNAAGSGALEVSLDSLGWDEATQSLRWEARSEVSIVDPETDAVIATVDSLALEFRGCSQVVLEFELEAGDSETTVVLRSGQLSFPNIGSDVAEGRATAWFSLRDLNGDGAQMVGLGGGGVGACRAYFNGVPPDATMFAHLVAAISVGGGGSVSASQRDPTSGYRAVGSAVSDMSAEVAFTLTAYDRLAASTVFDINPDPAECGDDADGDELPDWLDGCPNDPEKAEPGECGCGVADLDSDGDGIVDCHDNCPDTANPVQEDVDGDGVGDVCEEDGGPGEEGDDDFVDADDDGGGSSGGSESGDDATDPDDSDPDGTGDGGVVDSEDDPVWGPGWGGLFGFDPTDQAAGDEAVHELMSGVAGLCGFGAAGLLPLTLLGLSCCKLMGRRRLNRR